MPDKSVRLVPVDEIAYEDAINECSTGDAPWLVTPYDRTAFRNLAIWQIIVEIMETMTMNPDGKGIFHTE